MTGKAIREALRICKGWPYSEKAGMLFCLLSLILIPICSYFSLGAVGGAVFGLCIGTVLFGLTVALRLAKIKGNTAAARVLLLTLLTVIVCAQAIYALFNLYPQRTVFQDFGPYETMFVSSEITVLSFELFYLLLSVCGLLRVASHSGINPARRITIKLFAVFLLSQTLINTLCTSLDGEFLRFLGAKHLATIALFSMIENAARAIYSPGVIDQTNGAKYDIVTAVLLFAFFGWIFIYFMITDVFAFVYTLGYIHLAFALACVLFHIFRDPGKKDRLPDRVMRGLRVLMLVVTVLYTAMVVPLLLAQHHRALIADCRLDEVDEVLLSAETDGRNVIVCENEDLYFFFPLYHDIRFVTGSQPSKADEKNILVIPAAFHHAFELGFSHENIEGIYVDSGVLYRGGDLANAGAFTYSNGQAEIWNAEEAEDALTAAVRQGGSGYQQFLMLKDGEIVYKRKGTVCYRAVVKWKDRVCVIATKRKTLYADFLQMLQELGIEDAVYCDMGTGWNYSWYRKNDGGTKNLFGLPWPFSHAWLVFRK